jgi:hypothetical protein
MRRFIPQWLVRAWCWAHHHPQQRYYARQDGKALVIYTCGCGSKQSATLMPANRHIRRHVRKHAR